jgi:hypothetical protein
MAYVRRCVLHSFFSLGTRAGILIPLLAKVVHYMALHGAAVVPFAFRRSGKNCFFLGRI